MVDIVYVKVRSSDLPTPYKYKKSEYTLKSRDVVVIESKNGTTYGKVSCTMCNNESLAKDKKVKKILRVADDQDLVKIEKAHGMEEQAYDFCKEIISLDEIEMKLVDVESTINAKKLTFFFTAEKRVDFRELVKKIASKFRAKIEMVQIGVRDQSRRMHGYGSCGTQFCCNTFIDDFEPVTIKMAKQQGLSLNPGKISGICGRLMCCLAFEYDPNGKNPKRKSKKSCASGCGKKEEVVAVEAAASVETDKPVHIVRKTDSRSRKIGSTSSRRQQGRPDKQHGVSRAGGKPESGEQMVRSKPTRPQKPTRSTDNRQQASGNRQQASGNRQQGVGNRQQSVGNRQQSAGNRQQSAGNRQQSAGNRQQSAGNRQQGVGNRQQGDNVATNEANKEMSSSVENKTPRKRRPRNRSRRRNKPENSSTNVNSTTSGEANKAGKPSDEKK